jgi:hypothetical protein
MANLKTLDSLGGFSVGNTTIVSDTNDAKNLNTLEIKNQFFTDSSTTHYILRGLNTAVLGLDEVGSQIILPRNSINFITAHIIGVNNMGSGIISIKFESVVTNNSAGFVQELSTMETTIKDSIPEGESWTVTPFDTGSADRFSYSTIRAGTTNEIKWIASVQVVSIDWV